MEVRFTVACAVAALAFTSAARAQPPGDERLAGAVGAALRECPQLTIFDDVSGRVDAGTVVLTGKVTSSQKKNAVEGSVARLGEVREVKSEVQVLPASPSDDVLRYRISRAIYSHPSFWSYAAMPNPPVHIIVENGHVTLRGTVSSHVQRTMAGSLASGLGERSVANELRVRE